MTRAARQWIVSTAWLLSHPLDTNKTIGRFRHWLAGCPAGCVRKRPDKGLPGLRRHLHDARAAPALPAPGRNPVMARIYEVAACDRGDREESRQRGVALIA